MPLSLNCGFCVRCYEPHKKPWSYCIHVTKKKDLSDFGCFHFLFKINFFCSGVGATISDAVARSSIVFCNSVSADPIEVWSVECEVSVWSAKSAVWSVKCEVWGLECEGSSEKWEVWSVQCEVWSVKTLLRLSLKKSNGCRGKDTVGTCCLRTIGHLCLGNFRRRLARVYVR